MIDLLIIFKENQSYFGFYTSDFSAHFSVDKVWVTPPVGNPPIWSFEGQKKTRATGVFVHLSTLLGLPSSDVSYRGFIFLKEITVHDQIGLYMDRFFMQVPVKKIKHRICETPANLPNEVLASAFKHTLEIKRKVVNIIDPMRLFEAYGLLPL